MSQNTLPDRPRSTQHEEEVKEKTGALRQLYNRALITWNLFWDSRVPILPKLIPLAALVYLISPVDLIPEGAAIFSGPLAPFLAPLMTLDDVGIVIWSLSLFQQAVPVDILAEHLQKIGAQGYSSKGSDDDVVEGEIVSED